MGIDLQLVFVVGAWHWQTYVSDGPISGVPVGMETCSVYRAGCVRIAQPFLDERSVAAPPPLQLFPRGALRRRNA